ncbi:MAG: SRPBCC domain-containing protein [Rhodobacteraceae bacterium]|nr:SRPBCC domain-containing protein [Paracoccaceae bacterium]
MTALLLTASALALGLGAAFARAPRDGFETEIFIDAPPERVWALLTDPVAHADWNPMMQAVEGDFTPGSRIRLTMRTPSGGTMTFRPRVLVADPGRELRWLGRLGLPRLFDGEHYFRLIPEAGDIRLIHGERFRGLLLWGIDVHQFRAGFEAGNAALKERAEGTEPLQGQSECDDSAHSDTRERFPT